MDAEDACLIAGGRHDAAVFRIPAYDDGEAAKFGVIELGHGSKKRIQVEMDDRAPRPRSQRVFFCRFGVVHIRAFAIFSK
jgi:hypothetical protein